MPTLPNDRHCVQQLELDTLPSSYGWQDPEQRPHQITLRASIVILTLAEPQHPVETSKFRQIVCEKFSPAVFIFISCRSRCDDLFIHAELGFIESGFVALTQS